MRTLIDVRAFPVSRRHPQFSREPLAATLGEAGIQYEWHGKALGGYRGKGWQDISVTRAPSGAPAIRLEGNAKRRADQLGVTRILISFAHERAHAVAFAVAVAE